MEPKVVSVEIDEIRTGKVGVFSFYRKKSLINKPPFTLKQKNAYYGYQHHVDDENFDVWCRLSSGRIYPYDSSRHKADPWEQLMKFEMYKLIASGALNSRFTHEGKEYLVEVQWVGPEMVLPVANKFTEQTNGRRR